MISLKSIQEIHAKELSTPNIVIRSGDRWTNGAKVNGLKHKGLEYVFSSIPLKIYNMAKMYGGLDYWDKEDSINERKYMNNPQYKKDLVIWLQKEERKHNAEIHNSSLGR